MPSVVYQQTDVVQTAFLDWIMFYFMSDHFSVFYRLCISVYQVNPKKSPL